MINKWRQQRKEILEGSEIRNRFWITGEFNTTGDVWWTQLCMWLCVCQGNRMEGRLKERQQFSSPQSQWSIVCPQAPSNNAQTKCVKRKSRKFQFHASLPPPDSKVSKPAPGWREEEVGWDQWCHCSNSHTGSAFSWGDTCWGFTCWGFCFGYRRTNISPTHSMSISLPCQRASGSHHVLHLPPDSTGDGGRISPWP